MVGTLLPQELIRRKRDGNELPAEAIQDFVNGIARGDIGDGQIGAFAMAVYLNGMSDAETVVLTAATRDSGQVLRWKALDLPGPLLDKHSTGGVGDLVSLVLGPWVAACGGHVPMISGRGLGHTGGTLDKLESIPGYDVSPDMARFRALVKDVGVAIIGQTADLAPADKRLYAVRDVTATVESLPLIVASILGKKLACGLDGLVMDVKVGSGAFMPTAQASRELAGSLADVATRAGTPTTALLTDMNQPLAACAGNALEVHAALRLLGGDLSDRRLYEVTRALGVEMLLMGHLAATREEARDRLDKALFSGAAAERFARMVAGLGGPNDLLERPDDHLPEAPVRLAVHADREGIVQQLDTRALGMAVVELGGGRLEASAAIDHSVGLANIAAIGERVDAERPLAIIHARDRASGERAAHQVRQATRVDDTAVRAGPLIHDAIRLEDT
ncbi:thymidine phosphorylase [Halomonas sp. TRM85114]|uniref:thymidine phosphorylase n=1 Tax=Halomonas jincaotanensis TaxID=2810616 RepID=UPI001BD35106|nr:thymidine phosphorylase [Halomonas jincaotanensis]MBS9404559.1 thymidine phosphorylase [Halomonas jincaotanensis]